MSSSEFLEPGVIPFYVGQHERRRPYPITEEVIRRAHDSSYDMVTAPITNDKYHARVLSQLSAHLRDVETASDSSSLASSGHINRLLAPEIHPLTLADSELTPSDLVSQIVLISSPWIDLASPDPTIADISRQVLKQEITYAAFCGANNVIIKGPDVRSTSSSGVLRFARAVLDALMMGVYLNIQVMLPMTANEDPEHHEDVGNMKKFTREEFVLDDDEEEYDPSDRPLPYDSWDVWHVVRSVCKYNPKLSVVLTLPRHLPVQSLQSRWTSEPIRMLNIHSSTFLQNARGNNVLSKGHQALITRYMRARDPPWLLLGDADPVSSESPPINTNGATTSHRSMSASTPQYSSGVFDTNTTTDPTPAEASSQIYPRTKSTGTPEPYIKYIRQHLERRQPVKTPLERFGGGYQDFLQNPLQPLTDNLESITYEVFEKDPVKYDWYERAISAALTDWRRLSKPTSGPDGKVVVAIVGAGRGPLITRTLQASAATGVDVDVWAVEKNPNAFVLLQRHNMWHWKQRVNLVQSDMRSWNGPVYYVPKPSNTNSFESSTTAPQGDAKASSPEYRFGSNHHHEDDQDEDDESLVPTNSYVDIIVSELLGSFADNELSPECLDGIQHVLRPEHGISIPSSYTAHLTPISAPKLHADIAMRTFNGDAEAPLIPYVVMLHAIDYLSAKTPAARSSDVSDKGKGRERDKDTNANNAIAARPDPIVKQVWEFSHPIPRTILEQANAGEASARNAHNARFKRLRYPCKYRGVCHGLAGYFETVLYASVRPADDNLVNGGSANGETGPDKRAISGRFQLGREDKVELSTNPLTMEQKSKDMISWFPIYFPLKNPLYFPDDSELDVSIWRQTDGRKVWYEWMVESFAVGSSGPKRLRLGGSELHSSVKNGYLM